MSQINLDTSQFPSQKIINIDAASLFEANYLLAHSTSADIHRILNHCRQDLDYTALMAQAKKFFQNLLQLRSLYPQCFTTSDGINHLENYLECFCGFCQGAGISLEEGALLQLELYGGCQSLVVQNSAGEIAGFHTEEDSTAHDHFDDCEFGKYFVNLHVQDKSIHFLHYAGLCGWGYSYSLISSPNSTLISLCDVLGPTTEGVVWANAVNFMLANCQKFPLINELVDHLNQLPSPKFIGGHTNTLIDCCPSPQMVQIEFGGNQIAVIPPEQTENYSFHSGINYPHHPDIIAVDVAAVVEDPDKYDLEGLRRIYRDRFTRLSQAAKIIAASTNFDSISSALRNPEGEWRSEWFTGFSNCYVANHLIYTVSPTGDVHFQIKNGCPA